MTNAVYHRSLGNPPVEVNKFGSCPESREVGICVELCSSDMDCSGNQKCCSNGCGHVCQNPVDLEPQNPCDFGFPLSSVYCGRGPTHQDCPKGYSCKIDPVDTYAVCCPEDLCLEEGDSKTCYIDQCDVITCPNFPDARCDPNYCSGCYASFFVGAKNVTNICEGDGEPTCPEGSIRVDCKVDPCTVTKCPQFPRARCVPNYCGGCYAEFFVGEKNVTEKCLVSRNNTSVELCPDGRPPVACLVNPCDVTKCPKHPRARCVANYCGGCHADFFVGEKNVTKNCEASDICPDGSQPVKCDVNPCKFTKCPNSNCVPNYCGGCNAECR